MSSSFNGVNHSVNVSEISNGIYLYEIIGGDKLLQSGKIIIQK